MKEAVRHFSSGNVDPDINSDTYNGAVWLLARLGLSPLKVYVVRK